MYHRKPNDSLLTTRYFSWSIESSGHRTRRKPTIEMPTRKAVQTAKRNPKWFHRWRSSLYDLNSPIVIQATRPVTPRPLNRPNSILIVPGSSVALNPSAKRNEPTVKATVVTTRRFHVGELDNELMECVGGGRTVKLVDQQLYHATKRARKCATPDSMERF